MKCPFCGWEAGKKPVCPHCKAEIPQKTEAPVKGKKKTKE